MRGLRLYPKWHNYKLSDRCCADLVEAATERGMIVSIPCGSRIRAIAAGSSTCPMSPVRNCRPGKSHPKARFLLLTAWVTRVRARTQGQRPAANYAIETSRLRALLGNEFGSSSRTSARPPDVRHRRAVHLSGHRAANHGSAGSERTRKEKSAVKTPRSGWVIEFRSFGPLRRPSPGTPPCRPACWHTRGRPQRPDRRNRRRSQSQRGNLLPVAGRNDPKLAALFAFDGRHRLDRVSGVRRPGQKQFIAG